MPKAQKWTEDKIRSGFHLFFKQHGRYPTSAEIDTFPDLPSSRQIQRRYVGGLPALRQFLKLSGPINFTQGEYSSARARAIGSRAHELEGRVYNFLCERFGRMFVHREYFFTDDRRTRTDFFIYHKGGSFSVDVFYPKDRKTLTGCLNSKMRTYSDRLMVQYPVIFLMMNEAISGEELAKIESNKKNKLATYQKVMAWSQFQAFCQSKPRLDEPINVAQAN